MLNLGWRWLRTHGAVANRELLDDVGGAVERRLEDGGGAIQRGALVWLDSWLVGTGMLPSGYGGHRPLLNFV